MENTKKQILFFELPFHYFINDYRRDRQGNKTAIKTFQELEEYLFDNFESISGYDQIEADDDEMKEATEYVKSQVKKELSKQSKFTLDDYKTDLKSAVIRAKCDAWDSSSRGTIKRLVFLRTRHHTGKHNN